MRIHLIAIGGAAMHNLALALHHKGYQVTGSDDEIYDPSRSRLAEQGLLPAEMGWHIERITADIDVVIVGMHARKDNPELHQAQALGIPIQSYPEYLYEQSKDKIRVVVGGSHGKTTTTSMILHVLRQLDMDTDYLVGAQLAGFERMVRLSDAPIIVIEGDEYLASPLKPVPKFHFYKPHIAVLTGIAWDHINVFPTFENYVSQFEKFVQTIEQDGHLFYYRKDKILKRITKTHGQHLHVSSYDTFRYDLDSGQTTIHYRTHHVPLQIFGEHNLQNLNAARMVCNRLGIKNKTFFKAIQTFTGAAKRLQKIAESETSLFYWDFAHAPSKVAATVKALKNQYPNRTLVACFELHTFSSLNKKFLSHYIGTMNAADQAYVYFSEHTLKMKRLPILTKAQVKGAFKHRNIEVFTDSKRLQEKLSSDNWTNQNLLMMSSGNFGGLNIKALAKLVKGTK